MTDLCSFLLQRILSHLELHKTRVLLCICWGYYCLWLLFFLLNGGEGSRLTYFYGKCSYYRVILRVIRRLFLEAWLLNLILLSFFKSVAVYYWVFVNIFPNIKLSNLQYTSPSDSEAIDMILIIFSTLLRWIIWLLSAVQKNTEHLLIVMIYNIQPFMSEIISDLLNSIVFFFIGKNHLYIFLWSAFGMV